MGGIIIIKDFFQQKDATKINIFLYIFFIDITAIKNILF